VDHQEAMQFGGLYRILREIYHADPERPVYLAKYDIKVSTA
jgi:hypothetical protein